MKGLKGGIYIIVAILSIGIIGKIVYDVQNKEINVVGEYESLGYLDTLEATHYSQLATGSVESIEFSDNAQYLAVGISTANKLRVYEYNPDLDCYDPASPYPSVAGLGDVYSIDFSDDDRYLAVGDSTAPYMKVYDVLDDFSTISDVDLTTTGVIYDSKFYGDEYLLVGGNFTGDNLKLFRYVSGDFFEWSGITEFPTGIVRDIDYSNGYMFIVTEASPYLYVYKDNGATLDKVDITFTAPTSATYGIDISDNGKFIAVGTSASPYVNIYEFENEELTPVTLDTVPTQTSITYAIKFMDNNFLYTGGDLGIYKFKYNSNTNEFEVQTNDLVEHNTTIKVIDTTKTLDRIAVGDIDHYDCYLTDTTIMFDPIPLEFEPYTINSVSQYGVEKDFLLVGKNLYVLDELYDVDVHVDYDYIESSPNVILNVLPILATIGALILLIRFLGGKK